MLNSTNYTWAICMRVILNVHQVGDVNDPDVIGPMKYNITIAILFQAIPEDPILQVGEMETTN